MAAVIATLRLLVARSSPITTSNPLTLRHDGHAIQHDGKAVIHP